MLRTRGSWTPEGTRSPFYYIVISVLHGDHAIVQADFLGKLRWPKISRYHDIDHLIRPVIGARHMIALSRSVPGNGSSSGRAANSPPTVNGLYEFFCLFIGATEYAVLFSSVSLLPPTFLYSFFLLLFFQSNATPGNGGKDKNKKEIEIERDGNRAAKRFLYTYVYILSLPVSYGGVGGPAPSLAPS